MSDSKSFARRDFLKIGTAAAAGFLANEAWGAANLPSHSKLPPLPVNLKTPEAMPTRNLGTTGYRVGIFSLGGQAAIEQPNNEKIAVPLVERALDLGVNYIDTAAAYGGQERWSQRYIGQVMQRRRSEAFLATKTNDRTRDGSLRLLEQSLKLLNTDYLDLWQVHNLSRMGQIDEIFAKGGAMEAILEAKEQKIVRHVGLTGHADPDVLIEGIRRYPFETVLLALNAADRHHMSFASKLLPLAVEKQMGIIGMKIPARGRILTAWDPAKGSAGWEGPAPLKGVLTMRDALYYTLSMPVSTVIIGCDSIGQLEENIKLARDFTPLNDAQISALSEKTQPIAKQALFFRPWS